MTETTSLHALQKASRLRFELPLHPPKSVDGVKCVLCANECIIGEGERGFCGLRTVRFGKLVHMAGTPEHGLLNWYRDPLPTNCVADWVCEGSQHPGDHNLAVFYSSCTFNCLFCQNWHFRTVSPEDGNKMSAAALAAHVNERTFCVCYFGGDPASQMPHSLASARILAQRGVRTCWETNGTMQHKLFDAALNYALESSGCLKIDLKAWDEQLHVALTGSSNRRTLENFARAARRTGERPDPPLVVASTLLVPGYVESDEVRQIAAFIASINPDIPYALLAFAPNFYLSHLSFTSSRQARDAEAAARQAGLTRVRVGNRHLLDGRLV